MKIEFNKTEPFVSWGNAIGIVLYSRENDTHVNFFIGDMTHSRVNREELGSPSLVELKLELEKTSIMKRIIYLMVVCFIALPILQSCSSSRGMCKSKKKYYKTQKCWNAKKQKMVRC